MDVLDAKIDAVLERLGAAQGLQRALLTNPAPFASIRDRPDLNSIRGKTMETVYN